jgi:glycosyltransferase involved in cell wall biosynthesis
MNRLVCSSTDAIDAGALPPRERSPGGPARVLFLHGMEVGFATTTENLIHYAAGRADIDAVHVRLVMPKWLRLACTQSPVPVGELDYRYLRHMIFWRRHLRTLLGPGRALPIDRFDVVHISTQQRAGILLDFARPGRNATGTKFAVNIDATQRDWESMRGQIRIAPPIDWGLERRILRSADVVACATRWAAESATSSEYGVDPRRIVIHKPCARDPLAGREWTPRRPRDPDQKLRLVFIGGNWVDKGGPRLLKWHQARWGDRAELHIVSGSAPSRASAKNVVFHGKVPHERLIAELLPTMDIFVVPTKWDTFMIAAQEAQNAGIPVVSTRTGGVPECVLHKTTGFLCERREDRDYVARVEQLMDSPLLWHTMSAAARFHASSALRADLWHNHLLGQLVALADRRPIQSWPVPMPDVGPA